MQGQGLEAAPPAADRRPVPGPPAGGVESQRSKEPGLGQQLGRLANGLASGIKQVLQSSPRGYDGGMAEPSQPPFLGAGLAGPCTQPAAGGSTVADDEALARALQEQFDLEEERQRQQQLLPPVTAHGRNSQQHHGFSPDSGPNGGRGSLFSAAPPASQLPPQAHPAPSGPGACAGCGQPLMGLTSFFGGGRYVTALGRSWYASVYHMFIVTCLKATSKQERLRG